MAKDCCTLSELLKPMMGKPNIDNAEGVWCWCGKPATDKHHIVKRSAGKLVVGGHEVKKPTVRLCGMGNTSGCHGKAHAGLLHFRWREPGQDFFKGNNAPGSGHWEGLETSEPMKYQKALEQEGWRCV